MDPLCLEHLQFSNQRSLRHDTETKRKLRMEEEEDDIYTVKQHGGQARLRHQNKEDLHHAAAFKLLSSHRRRGVGSPPRT